LQRAADCNCQPSPSGVTVPAQTAPGIVTIDKKKSKIRPRMGTNNHSSVIQVSGNGIARC
jgi:hypothetical protein